MPNAMEGKCREQPGMDSSRVLVGQSVDRQRTPYVLLVDVGLQALGCLPIFATAIG